jgi:hypothetical protein
MPHQLRLHLLDHDVFTAVHVGFSGFKNGELLRAAEAGGYDVLLTGDLSIEHQQNMIGRRIAVVSVSANNWRIIQNHIPAIAAAIQAARPGSFSRVDCGKREISKN